MIYIYVLCQPIIRLADPEFKDKWLSILHTESNHKSKWSLCMNLFSLLRRLNFVIFALFVYDNRLQVLSILVSNTMMIIYLIICRPLEGLNLNRLEIVNEYLIFCISVILIVYIMPDETIEVRNMMGWV